MENLVLIAEIDSVTLTSPSIQFPCSVDDFYFRGPSRPDIIFQIQESVLRCERHELIPIENSPFQDSKTYLWRIPFFTNHTESLHFEEAPYTNFCFYADVGGEIYVTSGAKTDEISPRCTAVCIAGRDNMLQFAGGVARLVVPYEYEWTVRQKLQAPIVPNASAQIHFDKFWAPSLRNL